MSAYTLVDGLSDILVKSFENEGTTYRDEIEITDRSTKNKDIIQEYNAVAPPLQKLASRYKNQKKQFNEFDRVQKERRAAVRGAREDISEEVYDQLLEANPDTLESDYTHIDPETGEELSYKLSVKQSSRTKNIPKAEVKLFIRDSVENTLSKLYPKVSPESSFNKKHCKYLLDEQFVDAFYEDVADMMKKRVEELKSHITYVSLAKKKQMKKKGEDEDNGESDGDYYEENYEEYRE